jgi:hypothetical protein
MKPPDIEEKKVTVVNSSKKEIIIDKRDVRKYNVNSYIKERENEPIKEDII